MEPDKEDYSVFTDAAKLMPEGMKIIATGGKIFTASWMLMGFNNFCVSTIKNITLSLLLNVLYLFFKCFSFGKAKYGKRQKYQESFM